MKIRPNRLRSVTEGRAQFNALIADAEAGVTTHVVKGSKVLAHIVPASSRVVDDEQLLAGFVVAHAEHETGHAAQDAWREGKFLNAGDPIGRLLAWAWHTDAHLLCKTVAIIHRALQNAVGRTVDFETLFAGLHTAMRVSLDDGEIREIRTLLERRRYLTDYYPGPYAPPLGGAAVSVITRSGAFSLNLRHDVSPKG